MFRLLSRLFRPGRRQSRSAPARLRLESLEAREVLSVGAEEQLFVYLLNRARNNPVAYQQEAALPVSLAYVPARAPLAVNDQLFASTEFKAEEMATYNYFDHQSHVTGMWPNQLVRSTGYALPALFANNANYLESISYGWAYPGRNQAVATPAAALRGLIIDAGINPPGHRNHLLGIDSWNANFREIGVGHAARTGAINYDYWTIHTGYVSTSDVFLTGVVYVDRNANRRYDLNEGLAGVTVQAGGQSVVTNAAGGYSLQVSPNATYTVTTSGGAFVGTASYQVTVGAANVEVDFLSGRLGAQVNFRDLTMLNNAAPTLTAGVTLTPGWEDRVSPPSGVVRLLTAAADTDANARRGVAITGSTGVGTWQYYNGVRWYPLGAVSDTTARLLPDNWYVRFVPVANWNGTATLTYRAWDRTSGIPGTMVNLSDPASVGGLTAYSDTTATASLVVQPVNDAPVQPTTAVPLAATSRTATTAAMSVSVLLGGARDIDGPALGVALVGASGPGRWEFSTDGGTTWKTVAATRYWGRLLRSTDLVRFVPSGTATGIARLTFVAWDGSKGNADDAAAFYVPAALGGTSPFSATGRVAVLAVT